MSEDQGDGSASKNDSTTTGFARFRAGFLVGKQRVAKHAEQLSQKTIAHAGTIGGFLSQQELLAWSTRLTESAATLYDKALDAEYLRTHIGGGNHRLFDGGHDLVSAWGRVRDAAPDDSFNREVLGYVQALWKDVTTAKGLPFATWDQAQYNEFAETLAKLGISKKWTADLVSFDVFELLSVGLSCAGLVFALQRDDLAQVSELLGAMGITSILSANPITGLAAIAVTAYAYRRKRDDPGAKTLDGARFAKGALVSGLASGTFMLLGLPVLVELVIAIVVVHLAKKHAGKAADLARTLVSQLGPESVPALARHSEPAGV